MFSVVLLYSRLSAFVCQKDFDLFFHMRYLESEIMQENLPDLLTRSQVAKLLQISLPTVTKFTKQGLLPSLRVGKKFLRYERSAVLDFTQKTKNPVKPEPPPPANILVVELPPVEPEKPTPQLDPATTPCDIAPVS